MSLFRLPTLRKKTAPKREKAADVKRRSRSLKPRHLQIDLLEERALLSLVPADFTDVMVNEHRSVIAAGPEKLDWFDDFNFITETFSKYVAVPGNPTTDGKQLWGYDSNQVVASDNDGDFVVAWSRTDTIYELAVDADGNPLELPAPGSQPSVFFVLGPDGQVVLDGDTDPNVDTRTGRPYYVPLLERGVQKTDSNIYARYFTDEVQRITLPAGVLADNNATKDGKISFTYGGSEVQKLTISAAQQLDTTGFGAQSNLIAGSIQIELDLNGDGIADVTATFDYNEADFNSPVLADRPERRLEQALRGLTNDQSEIRVEAVNSREFLIYYGANVSGEDQPLPIVTGFTTDAAQGDSGFLPGALFTTVSQPYQLNNISVKSDPWKTAAEIERAFANSAYPWTDFYGPVAYRPENDFWRTAPYTTPFTDLAPTMPANGGVASKPAVAEVEVTPVLGMTDPITGASLDGLIFDITFVRSSGKKDVPELQITSVRDENGQTLLVGSSVTTLKQTSSEFRVNPDDLDRSEPHNLPPEQRTTRFMDQWYPAVAMDADGDFVITWASEESDDLTTYTDVYARRFSPVAMVPETNTTYWNNQGFYTQLDGNPALERVQGVRALGGEFRVNTTTPYDQHMPSVGMDPDGNFVIGWTQSRGQDYSFYNGVYYQRYNRDGEKLGGEQKVSTNDDFHFNVAIGMGRIIPGTTHSTDINRHGPFTVTWTSTNSFSYFTGAPIISSVNAMLFDDYGVAITPAPIGVGGGGDSTVSYDYNNNIYFSWNVIADADTTGFTSVGVRAMVLRPNGTVLRPEFRVNTGTTGGTAGSPQWAGDQRGAIVGPDADGDLVVSYYGVGPDLSEYVFIPGVYFSQWINNQMNPDLRDFFNPLIDSLYGLDVDSAIEAILIRATDGSIMAPDGTPKKASAFQLGQLRAILEHVAGNLRGDPNGIMFTSWDTNYTGGQDHVQTTDNIINSYRDGRNSRYIIAIDKTAPAAGNRPMNLGVYNPHIGRTTTVTVNANYVGAGALNATVTRNNLENDLAGAAVLGTNWPEPAFYGTVEVREIFGFELASRVGTPFDVSGIADPANYTFYEITFLGEAHDARIDLWTQSFPQNGAVYELVEYHPGSDGTRQSYQGMDIQPDGSFVTAWMQADENSDGGVTSTNVYYRRFREMKDTAGPTITDFLLPDGSRLRNNAQIAENLQYLVVTLDEDMMRQGIKMPGAPDDNPLAWITDPSNWRLLRGDEAGNYVNVQGGVQKVYFGMNMSANLNLMGLPVSGVGSNKWEAVIVFDGDGAMGVDSTALADGHYEVVAMNSLKDANSQPLGAIGTIYDANGNLVPNENGFSISRKFTISVPRNSETSVNETPGPLGEGNYSNQQVASNGDGDYVAVWAGNQSGIFAKLYSTNWSEGDDGARNSAAGTGDLFQFRVTSEATATAPAVARDADGDFVVVWQQQDLRNPTLPESISNPKDNWNIWARRYRADGQALSDPFRVNTTTSNIQKNPAVAMSVEGDFVVTWQSLDQDERASWGIFAQRYNPAGNAVGGENEIQMLSFAAGTRGDFRLSWNDKGVTRTTSNITYTGNTTLVTDAIRTAFIAAGISASVFAISPSDVMVVFEGSAGNRDVEQLQVVNVSIAGTLPMVSTLTNGVGGEFQVNETTRGDQQDPSLAMAADGSFVVTWTSYGQDADQPWQTNIYGKKFISNRALPNSSPATRLASSFMSNTKFPNVNIDARTFLVSADDPMNHVVPPGNQTANFPGVGQVLVNGIFNGTGTLLSSGKHFLTAAHVVTAMLSGNPYPAASLMVTFDTATGPQSVRVSQVLVNPGYIPMALQGGDIAILELADPVPAGVTGYDIYRGTGELGTYGNRVGYGLTGTGMTGSTVFDQLKRDGQNMWELEGPVAGVAPDLLLYDFDDGTAMHDAFGVLFGRQNTGLGSAVEVSSAPGDSGGPIFIGNLIAGVVTGGFSIPGTHDLIPGLQSSFGDMGADTRVSFYADWIDSILQGGSGEFLVNAGTINNPNAELNDQKWSSVAMDLDGDFVVTWTSYGHDGGGSGPGAGANGVNGVYARRFDKLTPPALNLADAFLVNTFVPNNQQRSRVAMDHDGDFVITWESFQDRPKTGSPNDDPDSWGIYGQRYARTELVGINPLLGPNGRVGSEFRVNVTTEGQQRYPGVAMDANGDFMIVWADFGPTTQPANHPLGMYFQRHERTVDDTGPIVADVLKPRTLANGTTEVFLIRDGAMLSQSTTAATQFAFDFNEALDTTDGAAGLHSILNPTNWELTYNGIRIPGGVVSVSYGVDMLSQAFPGTAVSGKFQAVVTLDGDPNVAGIQPLAPGSYVLSIRDTVNDLFGNPLDGNYDGAPGGYFQRSFLVLGSTQTDSPGPGDPVPGTTDNRANYIEANNQNSPAVASDSVGNYVVVWVSYGDMFSADTVAQGNIRAQRYDRFGQKIGGEILVNSGYQIGSQVQPDVAMDSFGNFVVVWAGVGPGDNTGIFAQRFDSFGGLQGTVIPVNTLTENEQNRPSVAMDANGNFIVTWTGYENPTDRHDIRARRFDSLGQPITPEFRVNTYTANVQDKSDVAMDAEGNIVVVWQSEQQDGAGWGVYGRRYTVGGGVSDEFQVNTYTDDRQMDPKVAMDADGDFAIAWTCDNLDGYGYGIYARRYHKSGSPLTAAEFRVNQTVLNWQTEPDVAMSDRGDLVITWTSHDQEGVFPKDQCVMARIYNWDGSEFINKGTSTPLGEFRINALTAGNQRDSAVAMDADGDIAVAFTGPDASGDGVYTRAIAIREEIVIPKDGGELVLGMNGWSGGFSGDGSSSLPVSVTVTGTEGIDTIEYNVAAGALKVNGVLQPIDSRATTITFDGLGGSDLLKLTGSTSKDRLELWTNRGTFTANGVTISIVNTERLEYQGNGGGDDVIFHDGQGVDDINAYPGYAAIVGAGYNYKISDFYRLDASSADGLDTAKFADSGLYESDAFIGTASYALMHDAAMSKYYFRVSNFKAVEAQSLGGVDSATLYDSVRNDTFAAYPTYAVLSDGKHVSGSSFTGYNYLRKVSGFDSVVARGDNGGQDLAKLYDSTKDDTFTASPTVASMSSSKAGYFNQARGFENVVAYATGGLDGGDRAIITGSAGTDSLAIGSQLALLSGFGYTIQAEKFAKVSVDGAGGDDSAVMTDTTGSDAIVGSSWYSLVSSGATMQQARAFRTVEIISTGGEDSVKLYGTSGKDVFVGNPTSSTLSGDGYSTTVRNFPSVEAFGMGGADEAVLNGSSAADLFEASSAAAELTGPNYSYRVAQFPTVEAVGNGGDDSATLTDSAADDLFIARMAYSTMEGPQGSYSVKATGFPKVMAISTTGADTAELYDSAQQDYFSFHVLPDGQRLAMLTDGNAENPAGSYQRLARNFANVKAYSTSADDVAQLNDSALSDLLEAEDNWVRLSNIDLKFAVAAYDFAANHINSSQPGNRRRINESTAALELLYSSESDWIDE